MQLIEKNNGGDMRGCGTPASSTNQKREQKGTNKKKKEEERDECDARCDRGEGSKKEE